MRAQTRPGELRFLDPAVIARLGTLELKARTIVEGFLSGLHRSPFKGFSVEFAEYRQYMPGDDLSTIDWKVFARSDRYYVKKFEEETNVSRPLNQIVDSLSKRGMVVLISDLLDDPDAVIRSLKHFQFRGNDVIVFHVLDPHEIDFPFDRAT